MRVDVAVLGAGMVGVCVALHLQKRGRAVVLVDRRGVAEETSFGNAGIIQREAVFPHAFPRDLGDLLRYGVNRSIDASYHLSALPHIAPFLWRYRSHSNPKRHAEITRSHARLIEHCVAEHDALAAEAGAAGLLRRAGWIRLYRTPAKRDAGFADAERAQRDYRCRLSDAGCTRAARSRAAPDAEPPAACIGPSRLRWAIRRRLRCLSAALRSARRTVRAGRRRNVDRERLRLARSAARKDRSRRGSG